MFGEIKVNQTRSIVEGASLLAVYVILLLLFFYLPIVGIFAMFSLSVPFIIYISRFGLKHGLVFWLSSFIMTVLVGGILAAPLTFMFGSSGLVIGYLIRKGSQAFSVLIGGSLAYVFNLVFIYILSTAILDINFAETINDMIEGSIQTVNQLTQMSGGIDEEQLEMLYGMADVILYSMPTALTLSGVTIAFLTIILANKILKIRKDQYSAFPPFREWNFPQSLLWIYLFANIMMIIGVDPESFLNIALINILFILEAVMTIQGLSFIFYYFHVKGLHKGIMITVIVFIIIIPILLYLVRILGIIDLGFNLKRRIGSNNSAKK